MRGVKPSVRNKRSSDNLKKDGRVLEQGIYATQERRAYTRHSCVT